MAHYSGCKKNHPDCICLTCKHDGESECLGCFIHDECHLEYCPDYEKEDDNDVQSAIPAER